MKVDKIYFTCPIQSNDDNDLIFEKNDYYFSYTGVIRVYFTNISKKNWFKKSAHFCNLK